MGAAITCGLARVPRKVRDASKALAVREERLSEAEARAAKHSEREAALEAQEAAMRERMQQLEAAQAAAAQRQQQLDELYNRVKADSAQLRDQAEGFEERRVGVITDLQVLIRRFCMGWLEVLTFFHKIAAAEWLTACVEIG